MSIIRAFTLLFVAGLAGLSVAFVEASEQSPPACSAPGCFTVADREPWPEARLQGGVRLIFGGYELAIPKGADTVSSMPGFLAFVYPEGRRMVITEDRRAALHPGLAEAGMTVGDWADIVFNRTPDDAPPAEPAKRGLWRDLLPTKAVFLGDAAGVVRLSRGDLTAYRIAGSGSAPHDLDVYVVARGEDDRLLRISFDGFDEPKVDAVLATLKQRK